MAAVAFTKIVATSNQIVYSWTGDAAGDLAYSILSSDLIAGPLKTAVASVAGECNSDAKAVSALLTGEAFTGSSGTSRTTNIQSRLLYTSLTTAKFAPFINALDDGAPNSPKLTITSEAASTGFLYITHVHSVIQ